MNQEISRREFLKLLALLSTIPLFHVKWPRQNVDIIRDQGDQDENQNLPNILILLFDTLSAKHVSLYGYNRETTPNLARLAERAVIYHSHYASANFTSPATASLFTGTYPWSHRAFHLYGTVDPGFENRSIFNLVPENYYRIAYTHNFLALALLQQFRQKLDYLKNTGDLCLGKSEFSDQLFFKDFNVAFQGETTYLMGDPLPSSAFFSWFNKAHKIVNERYLNKDYGYLFPRGIPTQHSLFFVLEDAIDWITDQITGFPNPFLSYIHLLPPHEPYTTRRDFIDIFNDGWNPLAKQPHFFSEGKSQEFLNLKRREYDEYIAYTDAELGRLLSYLENVGVLDRTYVIFTSDHGELFERGIQGHATQTLYEPLIRVPLLIFKPHQRTREDVYTSTSCVDLLPTLLDITGQPIPDWCEGRILPTFDDQSVTDRSIFALEAKSNSKNAPLTNATFAIIRDEHKLIRYHGYDDYESEYELYDLSNDPDELSNLYDSRKSITASLQQELEEKLREVNRLYS